MDALAARSLRPAFTEHPPYYASYVAAVPGGDIVETLRSQGEETALLVGGISEERAGHRYAEGKWSIRGVIQHVIDAERIYAYRALRFARADETPLAGFDEDAFVANSSADSRSLAALLDEFRAVRLASVCLYQSLTTAEWARAGTANSAVATVRAVAWISAGHELHHRNILKSRYL